MSRCKTCCRGVSVCFVENRRPVSAKSVPGWLLKQSEIAIIKTCKQGLEICIIDLNRKFVCKKKSSEYRICVRFVFDSCVRFQSLRAFWKVDTLSRRELKRSDSYH